MDKETFQKILEIYESPIKQHILNLLDIYHELSLTDLSKILEKSKSTISKYIKEMREIIIDGKSPINVREEKYRGSIKQKFYSRERTPLFWGKTYEDIKNLSSEETYKILVNEEYLINIRLFTLIKEVISLCLNHVNEFYTNLNPNGLDDKFKNEVYRYNTCIPRLLYYSKEEYKEYREKFIKFDDDFIKMIEHRRKNNPEDAIALREYLVCHAFLPIKRILDKNY